MSPEASASVATLARLRGELQADREALARRESELRELLLKWAQVASDRAQTIVAAVALHAWYTGLETLLERIARGIDQALPTGARSHAELLSQMMVEVPGLRPAVLSRSDAPDLLALLSFRHFFRHAYAVELDPARVATEIRRLFALAPSIERALIALDAFLSASLERASQS